MLTTNYISDETINEVALEMLAFLKTRKSEIIRKNGLFLYNKYLEYTNRDYSEYTLASLRSNLYDATKAYTKKLAKNKVDDDEKRFIISIYEASTLNNLYKIEALPQNLVFRDLSAKKNTMLNKILAEIPQKELMFLSA